MKTERRAAILASVTVGMVGGSYRGTDICERPTLTHLGTGFGDGLFKACGKPGNFGDSCGYSEEELAARPTCPRCAAAFDAARKGAK